MTQMRAVLFVLLADHVAGHGHITLPASTRHGGSVKTGNACVHYSCAWFSNIVAIPSTPTLPNAFRTLQLNVTTLPHDVYATSPWRAPGKAPVLGSGCGVGGGNQMPMLNGGECTECPQGFDGKLLPPVGSPEVWTRGGTAEVAWAIAANHGGGYSYRLCPADPVDAINEACFQSNQLDFAGNSSEILFGNGTRIPFPRQTTREGTYPTGSEWARNPVPGCYLCDAYETCGPTIAPVGGGCSTCTTETECHATNATSTAACKWTSEGGKCKVPPDACTGPATAASCEAEGTQCQWITSGSDHGYCRTNSTLTPPQAWDQQINCRADCDGGLASKALGSCPEGTAIFPEPVPGLSGWGKGGWKWSVADKVKVPTDLKAGPYLLSWRWDCEESVQVWQNCADVVLV